MVGLKLDEPIAKDLEKMVEKKVCEIIPGPAAPPPSLPYILLPSCP